MGLNPKSAEDLIGGAKEVHFEGLVSSDKLDNNGYKEQLPTTFAAKNGHKELREPIVIGVAGGASSGKTAVCNLIIEQLRDQHVVLVNQESFYYSLSDEELTGVQEYNFDHPGAFDTEYLISCMENLKHGNSVYMPNYNIKTYKNVLPPRGTPVGCDYIRRDIGVS